jgi:putative integral membrane protein (TIGR02587 family)
MARGSTDPQRFIVGLARGAAGALLFGIPMLMTMELWQMGFYIDRTRLLLLLLVNIPLLVLLARRIGFEKTSSWLQAVRDALTAYALAILISGFILLLLADLKTSMSISALVGKVAIQSVPASIGALLGRAQLQGGQGGDDEDADNSDPADEDVSSSYSHELFLMGVGALFLNLNVAPTEEIILIAYKMSALHALACILVSILIMHAFVYAVAFKGTHELPPDTPWWHALIRFTFPGYIVAVLISLYVLWTFGRLDGTGMMQVLMATIVLSFPGAIGAAAARLIL